MSEHTPGPWTDGRDFVRAGGGVYVIAQCYSGCDTSRAEARANSRLMAAAPDMLAALQWARMCVPLPSDCHAAVVAAINKATGETPTPSRAERGEGR